MIRFLLFPLSVLMLAATGCSSSEACDAEADSLECYCLENPGNCADAPDAITSSTPETLGSGADALPAP